MKRGRLANPIRAAVVLVLVVGCGTSTSSIQPAGSGRGPSSAARPSAPTTVASSSVAPSASPGTLDNPIDVASLGLPSTTIRPAALVDTKVGIYSLIDVRDQIWVGSPDGLVWIDSSTNAPRFIDHDHGAKLVNRGVNVWRSAYLDDRVTRYDGTSGKVLKRVELTAPLGMSASGPLWVSLHNSGQIVELNEATGKVLRTAKVGREGSSGAGDVVRIGPDVWVVSTDDESITQVDARTGEVKRQVDLGRGVCEQAAEAADVIWLCFPGADDEPPLVRRFDPATLELGPVYRFATSPGSAIQIGSTTWLPTTGGLLAVESASGTPERFVIVDVGRDFGARYVIRAFGSVWIAAPDGTVARIDPAGLQ